MAEAPAQRFVTPFEDSRRWRNITRRAGDIVISTPPKSGTTWTQGIVRSLLWPAGDAPGGSGDLSPWVDMRLTPIDDLADKLEQQTHRRFVKTHSPGDCIPFDNDCRYIVVYRDGRDALVSWGNHRAKMRPEIVDLANTVAAESGVEPLATRWDGDYELLFDEWLRVGSPMRHLGSWWSRRHAPNVLFMHYADLSTDLDGEMRRLAAFLDIPVAPEAWAETVARCGLERMRAEAQATGALDRAFDGGAGAFFYRGTNGRWRDLLSNGQVERYLALAAAELSDDAAAWLARGSLDLGSRPEELGAADLRTLDTGAWHPLFSRLQQRPANSIDAISERRVEEARAAGLFDDLALHGKPIPDIDRQRQPGWWANQFVANERNKVTALQLEEDLRNAMPGLWRLRTEAEVATEVERLNDTVRAYNRVTTLQPMVSLSVEDTLETWQRLRREAR